MPPRRGRAPSGEGIFHVFAGQRVKGLAFGKGPFSHTRYVYVFG
ncbi:MAG TPA: hypothetical protein VMU49_00340 [Candidatus Acidoferrales bacterium]|nr:hypothetical protein [Candidatus Acidoferrales bacterium]